LATVAAVSLTEVPPPLGGRSRTARRTAVALGAWLALVAIGRWWGLVLLARHPDLTLPEPPLLGRPGPGVARSLLWPVLMGGLLVLVTPRLVEQLRWRLVPWATAAVAGTWGLSVAMVEGTAGLTRGLAGPTELQADVPRVTAGPLHFLATFTARLPGYDVQVRGHPPGMILLLALLHRVGLGGSGWAAVLCVTGGCLAAALAVVTAGEVAGRDVARRAAPFVAIAPAAIWIVTSSDAFYLGVATAGVCAVVMALHLRGRASTRWAIAGGLLFGATLMLSYGLVLVAVVPGVLAWHERRVRPLVVAGLVATAVLGAVALTGFWWPLGLLATRTQYERLHVWRPWWYFVVADLSAWVLALGPALAVALGRLRDRRLWLLTGGGLLAAIVADLSGMSEAEVERIWLPFTIWVLLAGAALWPERARGTGRSVRGWLGLQVLSTIVIVATIRTQW
jgi:hypothetical protein